MNLNDLLMDGQDVPIMVVPPEQFGAGYFQFDGPGRPLVARRFRMIWRREDGAYVVLDPLAESAQRRAAERRKR